MDTRVGGFDWDSANRENCQLYGVSVREIEGIFDGSVAVVPDPAHSQAEERFKAVGRTAEGRHVFVIFTLGSRDDAVLIRPISARYMHRREVEDYEKAVADPKTDEEAERFVAEADLTEYDLSGMRLMRFEFQPKNERVNMRLPKSLLDAVKAAAAKAGMPYQRFIRQTLEAAIQERR